MMTALFVLLVVIIGVVLLIQAGNNASAASRATYKPDPQYSGQHADADTGGGTCSDGCRGGSGLGLYAQVTTVQEYRQEIKDQFFHEGKYSPEYEGSDQQAADIAADYYVSDVRREYE